MPEGRLFLLGDRRSDARDSRFFASDHGGTVPVDAVRGRVTDGRTGPAPPGMALPAWRAGDRLPGGTAAEGAGGAAGALAGAAPLRRAAVPGVSGRRRAGSGRPGWRSGPGPWRPRSRCRCPVRGR
ncbi:S26 family signal peptidase [Streptomyces rubradiris]|uniref:S26 family signal peptidase n=1 Tax=Streptomyces rubradiris TaxID=285531 RepID=UPI0036E48A53